MCHNRRTPPRPQWGKPYFRLVCQGPAIREVTQDLENNLPAGEVIAEQSFDQQKTGGGRSATSQPAAGRPRPSNDVDRHEEPAEISRAGVVPHGGSIERTELVRGRSCVSVVHHTLLFLMRLYSQQLMLADARMLATQTSI